MEASERQHFESERCLSQTPIEFQIPIEQSTRFAFRTKQSTLLIAFLQPVDVPSAEVQLLSMYDCKISLTSRYSA